MKRNTWDKLEGIKKIKQEILTTKDIQKQKQRQTRVL